MMKRRDPISTMAAFAKRLTEPRRCYFLAFEGLVTGGFLWRIRAWLAERTLYHSTKDQFEASGEEFEKRYKAWQALYETARFGTTLRGKKVLQATLRRLTRAGVCEPKLRTWIINGYLGTDGQLRNRDWTQQDRFTSALGWAWHLLVAVTSILFLTLTWTLPGALLVKFIVTMVLTVFFLLMSALMNSVSLSRLPPRIVPVDQPN